MSVVAPALQSEVSGHCPECDAEVSLYFDARAFCLAELAANSASVLSDVVTLAAAFHWAEADILSLPSTRRRAYVEAIGSSTALLPAEPWVA
jgi:hypothetical protein